MAPAVDAMHASARSLLELSAEAAAGGAAQADAAADAARFLADAVHPAPPPHSAAGRRLTPRARRVTSRAHAQAATLQALVQTLPAAAERVRRAGVCPALAACYALAAAACAPRGALRCAGIVPPEQARLVRPPPCAWRGAAQAARRRRRGARRAAG